MKMSAEKIAIRESILSAIPLSGATLNDISIATGLTHSELNPHLKMLAYFSRIEVICTESLKLYRRPYMVRFAHLARYLNRVVFPIAQWSRQ